MRIRDVVLVMLSLLCSSAYAIPPEVGMYWNPRHPGRGYYIEHQNGVVSTAIYAYESSGQPTFYIASGLLRADASVEAPTSQIGLFPIHGFVGDLYRVEGGACLTCFHDEIDRSVKVGRIAMAFPYLGEANVVIMDNEGRPLRDFTIRRFTFGFADWGGSIEALPLIDFRGHWIFVDESNPSSPPWRFHFTGISRNPEQIQPGGSYDIRYRDPSRNAELRCVFVDARQLTDAERNALPIAGCELFLGGEVLFSINALDNGVAQAEGFLGGLPRRGDNTTRRPGRIVGMRVPTAP